MKKYAAVVALCCSALVLSSCGKKETQTSTPATNVPVEQQQTNEGKQEENMMEEVQNTATNENPQMQETGTTENTNATQNPTGTTWESTGTTNETGVQLNEVNTQTENTGATNE